MSTDMTTPIDYDALIELISSDAIDANDFASQAVEAIRALRAAAVESERDAARYRFQHDNCLTFSPSRRLWELRDAAFLVVATGTAYTYEQAVDAAMAAQEKAQQQKECE